jgi:FixJ family two-component response regulator
MGSGLYGRSNEDNPGVLVIDDDRDVREGLKGLLDSVHLQSLAFESAQEFLRYKIK